jgi:peptidyl-prolyl cis-trans isomerase A (cyclophilin A)
MRRLMLAVGLAVGCAGLVMAQGAPMGVVGTVRQETGPIAGATVQAVTPGSQNPVTTATTGADGAYRLALPRGVYRLDFAADGFESTSRTGVVVLEEDQVEVNVVMRRPGSMLPDQSIETLRPGEVGVRLDTPLGIVIIAVDTEHAPITSGNFLKYVDAGLYNGGRFHRATRPDNYTPAPPNRPMMELIQGGINPDRRDEGFGPIPLERTSTTGLKHVAGTVSMARGTAADTATSDFFILLDDQPSLDAGGLRFEDGQGAAAFGRVIFGMGAVRNIQQQPTEGQNLTPPVPIINAARTLRPGG